jgi:hypothetical protein
VTEKTDPRVVADVVVEVWFKINGAQHYDFEATQFGGECGYQVLKIHADGRGSWNGTQWVGDMLYTDPDPC